MAKRGKREEEGIKKKSVKVRAFIGVLVGVGNSYIPSQLANPNPCTLKAVWQHYFEGIGNRE
jgi:hypothetical protein